jgi:hypothetical protein
MTGKMTASKAHLSFLEKVDIIPAQLGLSKHILSVRDEYVKADLFHQVASLLYNAIAGLFRDDRSPASYKHHVTHAMLRALLSRLTTAQLQYVAEPLQKPRY